MYPTSCLHPGSRMYVPSVSLQSSNSCKACRTSERRKKVRMERVSVHGPGQLEAPRGPGLETEAHGWGLSLGDPGSGSPTGPSAQQFLYEVPPWVMCRFYKMMDALEPSD